ncbi:MAG: tetratricopeptide repeat protein, partial [Verrucomicrobiota bacterium]
EAATASLKGLRTDHLVTTKKLNDILDDNRTLRREQLDAASSLQTLRASNKSQTDQLIVLREEKSYVEKRVRTLEDKVALMKAELVRAQADTRSYQAQVAKLAGSLKEIRTAPIQTDPLPDKSPGPRRTTQSIYDEDEDEDRVVAQPPIRQPVDVPVKKPDEPVKPVKVVNIDPPPDRTPVKKDPAPPVRRPKPGNGSEELVRTLLNDEDVSTYRLIAAGDRLLQQGRVALAESLYEKALVLDAQLISARLGLAACAYTSDHIDEAEFTIRQVLKTDPKNPQALGLMGIIARRQGNLTVAAQFLERAIELDAKDPQLYNYLGIVMHDLKDSQVAMQHLRKAEELDPDHAEVQFNLAVLHSLQTNPNLQ